MLRDSEIQARYQAAAIAQATRKNLQVTFLNFTQEVQVFTPDELCGDLFRVYQYLVEAREEGVVGATYNMGRLGRFYASLV